MASRRLLTDTVVLYNYIGEVNDVASFQETRLTRCYCPLKEGADLNLQGKRANNSATLYIFDADTIAVSPEGYRRTYMPYNLWKDADDKEDHWTLSDKGTDYFKKECCADKLRITAFNHLRQGSHRMWHFEVDGK